MRILRTVTPLVIALLTAGNCVHAQQTGSTSTTVEKEISIGSHVLKQAGESEYSYKNEAYTYNKIWEVPNASKAVLYERTRKWLQNVTGATVTNIADDPTDNSSLGATIELQLPETSMKDQTVTFRFKFSFKDNKVRLQAEGFRYYGRWDRGYQTRQVYVANRLVSEQYYDAGEYKKDLHDLKPMTKKQMRGIYEVFDEHYLKLVRSMKASVLENADNNW